MQRLHWEEAISRALVDGVFRARLLGDPVEVLSDYGLQANEAVVIEQAKAPSLSEFVGNVLRSASSASGWWFGCQEGENEVLLLCHHGRDPLEVVLDQITVRLAATEMLAREPEDLDMPMPITSTWTTLDVAESARIGAFSSRHRN